jgi:hypothetical protein
LARWRESGAIREGQFQTISALVRKDVFPVFIELNALLYVGVLSIAAGVGWVIHTYVAALGDAAILSGLTLVVAGCFFYCFSRALPYSNEEVESPNLAFDYVLYLACLVLGAELGYIESRFRVLESTWDFYLLFSSIVFFALAYRFDNRFVLSLGLSTLAAWFGIRVFRLNLTSSDSMRACSLVYGAVVAAAGLLLYWRRIKKHFTGTYLHVAANVLFLALLSGIVPDSGSGWYLLALPGLSAVAVFQGLRFRRFAFVVYGIIYGYIGISAQLMRGQTSTTILGYLVVSGSIVIAAIIMLARQSGREE